MDAAEFDRFADEYDAQHRANIAITGEAPEYFAEYKIRVLSQLAKPFGPAPDVLDFGSGIGNSVPHFRRHMPGARLSCADVSCRSLDLAERRFPSNGPLLLIEGDRIPSDDNAFDVVFSACVFHHIPHEQHGAWLRELRRVARPGALLVVFEHNPLNPLTVHAVNTCPFDENAKLLRAGQLMRSQREAGWERLRARYHVFFPRAFAALRPLEGLLAAVPFGAQYSAAAWKPR